MKALLDTADDCTWLRETHLRDVLHVPNFASFIIEGNEDCPLRLELFKETEPTITDVPVAVYTYDANNCTYELSVD
jgi:hypothetical protein